MEALVPLKLGLGHFAILGLLSERGDLTQQQLIDVLEIDKSAMVYLVDELEAQHLAERRLVPGDRRARAVHLTDSGRECLIVAGKTVKQVEQEFLAPLTTREQVQLKQLLQRIAQ